MNSRSTSSPSFPLRQAEEAGPASCCQALGAAAALREPVITGFTIIRDSMTIQARSTRPAGVRLAPR